jgi:branched-chain amino acid transport system substrate-binding protein
VSMFRSTVSVASSIVLASLTLVACGDSKSDSDGAAPTTSAAAAPKGTPLRVGLLVNKTGKLPSGEENAAPVVEAWAKAVNAQGGVAGHPVEIVVADSKGDAPAATAAVAKMTSDQSIVAAVMFDANAEGVVAAAIEKAGLPVIGGMGYAPNAWGKMPNWLPLTTSIPSIFNMGMQLGKSLGASRTALTICGEAAECGAATPVVKNASTKLGMTFAGSFKVISSAPSYTAECLQIVKANIDYVMLGAATTNAALRLAKDCTTQGYRGKWGLFGGVIFPKAMRQSDPGVKLDLVLNSFPWFADAPPVAAYRKMMEDQGVDEAVWGDLHSTAAYATMQLLRKTLDANASQLAAKPTRRDIVKAYGTVKDETLDGLLAQPITFHPDKPNPLVTCYWFGSYEQGTFSNGHLDRHVCDDASLKG